MSDGFHFIFLFLIILYVWFVTSHVASFNKKVMTVSAQFYSTDSYAVKRAGLFTFQMTRYFGPSLA